LFYFNFSVERKYCTVLAVLAEDNRLSHATVHTFFIPDFNGRYYNRSVTTSSYTNGVNNGAPLSILRLQTEELLNSRRLSSLEAS
jgi:hypothetical protein